MDNVDMFIKAIRNKVDTHTFYFTQREIIVSPDKKGDFYRLKHQISIELIESDKDKIRQILFKRFFQSFYAQQIITNEKPVPFMLSHPKYFEVDSVVIGKGKKIKVTDKEEG